MAAVWELFRTAPPQRSGERILLEPERGEYRVGRSASCDLQLFSPTASREHALLRIDEAGSWVVEPVPGRQVIADGEPIDGPCELCEGLSLEMGGDRLRCRAAGRAEEAAEADARDESGEATPLRDSRPRPLTWAVAALAFGLLVLIVWRMAGA